MVNCPQTWRRVDAGKWQTKLQAAGWQVLKQSVDDITFESGYVVGVGIDFKASTSTKLGLDASYQHLWSKADFRSFRRVHDRGAPLVRAVVARSNSEAARGGGRRAASKKGERARPA